VLNGVARRVAAGRARPGTAKAATAKARRAGALLADLRRDGIGLADVPQPWLDSWVAAHPAARPDVRAFLRWARHQGVVGGDLDVAPAASAEVRLELDGGARWAVIARLLNDGALEGRDRVAGFLLIALGQPLTRIVTLTADDVRPGRPVRLRLGPRPLRVEPPIDGLLLALADAAHAGRSPGCSRAGPAT
jgi:hypothetical protein